MSAALLAVNIIGWVAALIATIELAHSLKASRAGLWIAGIFSVLGFGYWYHLTDYSAHMLASTLYVVMALALLRLGVADRRLTSREFVAAFAILCVAALTYNSGLGLLMAFAVIALTAGSRLLPVAACSVGVILVQRIWPIVYSGSVGVGTDPLSCGGSISWRGSPGMARQARRGAVAGNFLRGFAGCRVCILGPGFAFADAHSLGWSGNSSPTFRPCCKAKALLRVSRRNFSLRTCSAVVDCRPGARLSDLLHIRYVCSDFSLGAFPDSVAHEMEYRSCHCRLSGRVDCRGAVREPQHRTGIYIRLQQPRWPRPCLCRAARGGFLADRARAFAGCGRRQGSRVFGRRRRSRGEVKLEQSRRTLRAWSFWIMRLYLLVPIVIGLWFFGVSITYTV